MWPHLPGGRDTLVYQAADATPASYAVFNFEVDDVDEAVDALAARAWCALRALRRRRAGREGCLP
jgi:hypothetical protein